MKLIKQCTVFYFSTFSFLFLKFLSIKPQRSKPKIPWDKKKNRNQSCNLICVVDQKRVVLRIHNKIIWHKLMQLENKDEKKEQGEKKKVKNIELKIWDKEGMRK